MITRLRKPIHSDSVGSIYVYHGGRSTLPDYFDRGLVLLSYCNGDLGGALEFLSEELHDISQKVITGKPSPLNAESSATISDSVEERETTDCLLLIAETMAKLLGPTRATIAPDVDLLVLKSPANPASTYMTMRKSATTSLM